MDNIMVKRETMELAVELLESLEQPPGYVPDFNNVIATLRTALAAQPADNTDFESWLSTNPIPADASMKQAMCIAHAASSRSIAAQPTPTAVPPDEQDAARYRWLRSEHDRVDPICHLVWKADGRNSHSEWVNTAILDAAIDAAMIATAGDKP